ncbi:MAG: DUF6386 family protein [Bacteroidota bacterium]
MLDTTLDLGTDVATFLIYHPDDLAHRADAPLGWYGYDFAYVQEARAGRMVAIGTGSDGGYRIRLTTSELTPAEAAAETTRIVSPLIVRHGRVFVGNTDGLPGLERMIDPDAHPDQWLELANGAYRVSVVEVDWSGDEALPSYVVMFKAVASMDEVEVPERFPMHSRVWGTPPPEPTLLSIPSLSSLDAAYPLLVLGDDAVVPGQTGTTIVPRDMGKVLFDLRRVVVTAEPVPRRSLLDGFRGGPETLGTVTRIRGARWAGEAESRVTLEGVQLVRVLGASPGDSLPRARVEGLARPDRPPSAAQEEALLDALAAFGRTSKRWASQSHPLWTLDRVEARNVRWPEAIRIALDTLGLTYAERLGLARQSDAEQVETLTQCLRDAT